MILKKVNEFDFDNTEETFQYFVDQLDWSGIAQYFTDVMHCNIPESAYQKVMGTYQGRFCRKLKKNFDAALKKANLEEKVNLIYFEFEVSSGSGSYCLYKNFDSTVGELADWDDEVDCSFDVDEYIEEIVGENSESYFETIETFLYAQAIASFGLLLKECIRTNFMFAASEHSHRAIVLNAHSTEQDKKLKNYLINFAY